MRLLPDDFETRSPSLESLDRTHQPGHQATPAPVLSGTSLGVVIHTAMRQATQSVMKYIARKTTKLVYPPHWYSTKRPTRYANTSPAATRAKNQIIRAILMSLRSELHRMISPGLSPGLRRREFSDYPRWIATRSTIFSMRAQAHLIFV